MRWFTSDTHFWHKQIIDYDERPYSDLYEMEESIIQRHNQVVSKRDVVYHLGDFAFGNPRKWKTITDRLHGQITLVRGNHDLQNGATLRRLVVDGVPIFNDVCDIEFIDIQDIRVQLSHYPYWVGDCIDTRMKEYRPVNNGRWLVHGHSHKLTPKVDKVNKMINVGCMLWDYTPVSENEIYLKITEAQHEEGIR